MKSQAGLCLKAMLCTSFILSFGVLSLASAADEDESELIKKIKNAGVAPAPPSSQVTGRPFAVHLIDHPACNKDLEALAKHCQLTKEEMKDDFAALMCAQQRSPEMFEAITETCEQVLWAFKNNLTKAGKFIQQVEDVCNRDDDKLANCRSSYRDQPGHYLSCVVGLKMEHKLKPACADFLNQLEMIIFSDYRLIGDFVEKCEADIEATACGRVSMKTHSDTQIFYHHSQGTVLECLSDHLDKLNNTCRHEMLRVAELQSDDFHLDRSLYFACKSDREQFCKKVLAGDGRVYECLIQNKRHPEMSADCKKQIRRRQKLVSEDYKISLSLAKACKSEIRENQCRKNADEFKPVRLAQILLCLEDVVRNDDNPVSGRCRSEMTAHRKMLMDDFNLSPEVVTKCAKDIQDTCKPGNKPDEGGMTIHCLMGLAATHKLQSGRSCENEIRLLLREANVVDDWSVDPYLKKSCQDVVTAACDPKAGPSGVMSCLMVQLSTNSKSMTNECKATLMEIEYFISRDFVLDPKLYQKCRKDAQRFCNAEDDWHLKSDDDGSEAKLVFPCLVRHLYGLADEEHNGDGDLGPDYHGDQGLEDDCADQVERVLEQRAVSVNLHPEIEDSCREFLIHNCGKSTGNGEEIKCLQDNLSSLSGDCLDAVKTYTQLEAKNAVLNPVIASACHQLIDKHCEKEVSRKDEGDVLQCLIRLKEDGDEEMDEKCEAAVEHWQILSLDDWRFSFKFKTACKEDIKTLCPAPKTKVDVIGCLSKISRDDILTETRPPRISKSCRAQLKFELLQKHSNIKLNPALDRACKTAIGQFCSKAPNVIECLKQQDVRKLDSSCRKMLFKEEEEEVLENSVDHVLMVGCKHEIKTHCQEHSEPNGIFNCLKEVKDDPNFDKGCKQIVNHRIISHAMDYRLRPRLQKSCQMDLKKFCAHVLLESGKSDLTNDFLEGKVIKCLEAKFAESAELLTTPCRKEIETSLRDAALDYRANPELSAKCPKSIEFCQKETKSDPTNGDFEDGGRIEECLRTLFHDRKLDRGDGEACKEAVATLIEFSNADIHTDPILHEACSLDLSKFCREVPQGNSQQLKCLALVLQDTKLKLEIKCSELLQKRMEMFNMALKVVPIQGLQDIIYQVNMSPHKNYFLMLAAGFLTLIFVGGLLCGRVTKRVRREMKNR